MIEKNMFVIILFCMFYSIKSDDSPVPFITKCKTADEQCITKSTQEAISTFVKGMPNFEVEQLDPMIIKSMDASTSQLKLFVKNLKLTGFKGCQVHKMDRNTKGKLVLNTTCDFKLDGTYEMDGNILLLKIEGNGDFHHSIGGLNLNAIFDLEEFVGKDGLKYWRITKWTYVFKALGKSTLHFENLFHGNKVLAQATQTVFDNSSNDVIEEIGGPVIDYVIKHKVIKAINNFFMRVPIKYLSID